MPAPRMLSGLPKPLLFGLYGAAGGLLGALVFAELLYRLLTPPPAPPAAPQIAVAAAKDVEVFVDGRNTVPVQVARGDNYKGPITVRFENLPAGVTAEPVTIPGDKTGADAVVVGSPKAAPAANVPIKLVAEAEDDGRKGTAETPISLKVTDPPKPQADIVFVLDVTASMQWAIDDLKNGIGKFADTLAKARIDYRLGLVAFRDDTLPGEGVDVIRFKGDVFTADGVTFRERVGELRASGGGDIPESSFEAVAEAARMKFRPAATKVLLLITDAPPKTPRAGEAVRAVRDANVDSVHLVVQRFDVDAYTPLTTAGADKAGGKYFNLGDVVRGDEGFDPILESFGTAVTAAALAKSPDSKPTVPPRSEAPGVKSLQSGEQSAAGTEGKLILRSGVWTGAIAALVCLALLAGQHHYLRGTLPAAGGMIVGIVGGLAVGLAGGAAGQGLYLLAQGGVLGTITQVLGWALLGGLAGAGLSLFIPNLKWTLGLAGGAVGGAVGAVGFIAVSSSAGDLLGRLAGGLLLGFCIGLMVAIVEAAFRRAWLEVRFGVRETINVTLGPEPVKVGGDAKACTVWARGAAPVALRFFIRDGQVVCDDPVMRRESAVADGFSKEVGNVTVTVRTGSGAVAAPSPPPPSRPAARRPAADEDDDFGLPMPISPPTVPPAKAPTVPLSLDDDPLPAPVPPKPSAPKPAPPPVPAAGSKPAVPPVPPKPVAPPPKPPTPVAGSKPSMPPVPPRPAAPAGPRPPAAPRAAAPDTGPKHPDACPSCGRVNAGKPKQRYCMVCDHTY